MWPGVGETVRAPDWLPTEDCGNGLHGWLYGQGDHSCSSYLDDTAVWLVLEVVSDTIVMLGGKCKFPECVVRFVGDRNSATQFLRENEPRAREVAVIGASMHAGDRESAVVGALGTATAGDGGTATAGNSGTATAGDDGTATAGYRGTATAGNRGTATAGDGGTICLRWWDASAERYRTEVAYVGEGGIEANVAYRLSADHKFVRAE